MDRVRKRIYLEGIKEDGWPESRITIAVLDSGMGKHPDLDGRCICFRDFVNKKTKMYDDNGHGTHVCGILCGSGALSEGKYRGIVSKGRLVVGKVLDERGDGKADTMLEGLNWILNNRKEYDIRLLNISVGIGDLQNRETYAKLKDMVEKIWDAGIVVVCAAGNKGPAEGSISAVGGSDKVITVGCYDDLAGNAPNENCAFYSGRGSETFRKPDIVAPGTNIISCCYRCRRVRNRYTNRYFAKSGTSMATPIVTGCAALLLLREPYLQNVQVKDRLHYSAQDLGLPWNLQGWGMVHAKRLLENARK